MKHDKMLRFLETPEGDDLYALIGDFNTVLHKQFLPPAVIETLGDTKHFDYLSDYSFDFLAELVAKADDILHPPPTGALVPGCPYDVLERNANCDNPRCRHCGPKCDSYVPF